MMSFASCGRLKKLMCSSAKKCLLSSFVSSLGCASARKLRLGRKRCTFWLTSYIDYFSFIALVSKCFPNFYVCRQNINNGRNCKINENIVFSKESLLDRKSVMINKSCLDTVLHFFKY
jgi:hypothetical protein